MTELLNLIVVLLSVIAARTCQELVDNPQNATVVLGQNVTLKCVFSKAVPKCAWYHNGTDPISAKGRYQYHDAKSNGVNTSDCSLLITNFMKFDATVWHCSIAQDAEFNNDLKSNKCYLTMASSSENEYKPEFLNSEVVDHPQSATVEKSGTVLLKCIYKDVITKCEWYRNGKFVTINNRYKYHRSNGENTKDCTIEINKFSDIDATQWQCTCAGNSNIENENSKSNSAYLELTNSSSNDSTMTTTNLLLLVLIGLFLMAIIVFVAIYCHRTRKAKRKVNSRPPLSTFHTSQPPSVQENHEYTYILDSDEDAMGYMIPQGAPISTQKPEINFNHHTYEEIPE